MRDEKTKLSELVPMVEPTKNHNDRRVKRTKALIFDAFTELVQSRRYDEIKTLEIIEKANIGKSTFYEHFLDKNDVLKQSLEYPMSVFAQALTGQPDAADLAFMLDHFWQRRTLARVILSYPTREIVEGLLKDLIAVDLRSNLETEHQGSSAAIASFLSSGFVGILSDWLSGKITADKSHMIAYLTHFSFVATTTNEK